MTDIFCAFGEGDHVMVGDIDTDVGVRATFMGVKSGADGAVMATVNAMGEPKVVPISNVSHVKPFRS